MSVIYSSLISKIKTTFEAVTNIKEVFAHPASKLSKYPAVVFYSNDFENSFETVADNYKIYSFKAWVIIGCPQTSLSNVFETVMPNTIDAILEEFDAEWDGGTIDGHRVSILVDGGNWGASEGQAGLEAWAELNIKIKVLTTN